MMPWLSYVMTYIVRERYCPYGKKVSFCVSPRQKLRKHSDTLSCDRYAKDQALVPVACNDLPRPGQP